MKGIYRFGLDYGRMGEIDAVFVVDSDDIKKIDGETIYFGEILGKHSDVECEVSAEHFELISDKPEEVEMFERLQLQCGHSPFDHWDQEEDESDEEE